MKIELFVLAGVCYALSFWVTPRGQRHLLRRTLPQIYAEAKAGRVRSSAAGTVLALLGLGLTLYAAFWVP